MLYAITHPTTYRYQSAVSVSQHLAHLRPRETARQQVLEVALEVEPTSATVVSREDYYGNLTDYLSVEGSHREFRVTARSRVRVTAPALPEPRSTLAWEKAREACTTDVLSTDSEVGEFLFDSPFITTAEPFADYARRSFAAGRPILEAVADFIGRIFRDFQFDRRATTIATPVEEVFRRRRGVCQDFAHLAITCLRSLGLPARYVSGYIETVPPPGKARLVGADASHAWFAFWCPGFGWIDADPTNNLLCADRHVTVAWGRDFSDVSPLRGVVVGGGEHRLQVAVDVEPIKEAKVESEKPGSGS